MVQTMMLTMIKCKIDLIEDDRSDKNDGDNSPIMMGMMMMTTMVIIKALWTVLC